MAMVITWQCIEIENVTWNLGRREAPQAMRHGRLFVIHAVWFPLMRLTAFRPSRPACQYRMGKFIN